MACGASAVRGESVRRRARQLRCGRLRVSSTRHPGDSNDDQRTHNAAYRIWLARRFRVVRVHLACASWLAAISSHRNCLCRACHIGMLFDYIRLACIVRHCRLRWTWCHELDSVVGDVLVVCRIRILSFVEAPPMLRRVGDNAPYHGNSRHGNGRVWTNRRYGVDGSEGLCADSTERICISRRSLFCRVSAARRYCRYMPFRAFHMTSTSPVSAG